MAQVLPSITETNESQNHAQIQRLAHLPAWESLLHLHRNEPQIANSNFLLSWPHFSVEAELKAMLALLHSEGQIAACRFPARTLWLQNQMHLPNIDTEKCPEIEEFVSKAPFEKLELVFADESVTQPASILGHSFLKISGMRQGRISEHAVSFYTHAESINLPKLLWESLVTGKQGLFSLTPYELEENKYQVVEQRNLWQYEILTTPQERALIRNHLFELKNSQLTYFFHRYNCATVLRNILGLGGELPPAPFGWSTPKDVVKDLHTSGRVVNTQVHLADSWLVAQMTTNTPDLEGIRSSLLNQSTNPRGPDPAWVAENGTALQAYNRLLRHKGQISAEAYARNLTLLTTQADKSNQVALLVDPAQNPVLSNGETHLRSEWRQTGSTARTLFQWIPVSHTLMQAQGPGRAETELILLSPTVSLDAHRQARLEEFQVFAMKSLIPWDPLLRPWSTQTLIGYGPLTGHPNDRRSANASLELGITTRQGNLDLFAIAGPGLKTPSEKTQPFFIRADMGILWRHGDKAKSRLTLTHWIQNSGQPGKLELEQSWFLKRGWDVGWRYGTFWQSSSNIRSLALSLAHSF